MLKYGKASPKLLQNEYVCNLSNNAVSSSDYKVANDRMVN